MKLKSFHQTFTKFEYDIFSPIFFKSKTPLSQSINLLTVPLTNNNFSQNTIMEQPEFLEQNIFTDLKNLNDGFDQEDIQYFSESDFETILQRAEHFGISIYIIKTSLNGETYEVTEHVDHKKKATDPRWFKKAFLTLKTRQAGLLYSATYKVSKKLLAR